MTTQHDPYFKPLADDATMPIPDSIEGNERDDNPDTYEFLEKKTPDIKTLKQVFLVFISLSILMMSWQVYGTLMEIMALSVWLGGAFGFLVLVLLGLVVKQAYIFRKGQLKFKTIERLRDQAETFVKEKTHGKSTAFIEELRTIYADKPQEKYLQKVLDDQPDYLNDAEVITRLSDDFLSKLDEEALRLVKQRSLEAAGLVALSQLAVIDSLIVLWKSIGMVNQINGIYGLGATRIGQWRVLIKIANTTLLSAGSQCTMGAVVQKTGVGPAGTIVGGLAQGLGIGMFVAKIGIEAMKTTRPIVFEDGKSPNLNLMAEVIKMGLGKIFAADNDSNKAV